MTMPGQPGRYLAGLFEHPETRLLIQLNVKVDLIMSGLSDLQGAITAMQAEWTTFLADLKTALGNADSDAAVEAAAQLVEAQTAALVANDPSTPAPAPAPSS